MPSLVAIATFDRQYEASLAKARLESEGIRAFIHGENVARVFTGVGGEMGSVILQVAADDEDHARAILAIDEEGYDEFLMSLQAEVAGDTTEDGGTSEKERFESRDVCPRCGSDNMFTNEYSPVARLGAYLLLGIPFLFMKREHECAICGYKWRA